MFDFIRLSDTIISDAKRRLFAVNAAAFYCKCSDFCAEDMALATYSAKTCAAEGNEESEGNHVRENDHRKL